MKKEVEAEVKKALAVLAAAGIGTVTEEREPVVESTPQAVPSVRARVRDGEETVESAAAEVCWHCAGKKICRCTLCAVARPRTGWGEEQCRVCWGSGHLTWGKSIQ